MRTIILSFVMVAALSTISESVAETGCLCYRVHSYIMYCAPGPHFCGGSDKRC